MPPKISEKLTWVKQNVLFLFREICYNQLIDLNQESSLCVNVSLFKLTRHLLRFKKKKINLNWKGILIEVVWADVHICPLRILGEYLRL